MVCRWGRLWGEFHVPLACHFLRAVWVAGFHVFPAIKVNSTPQNDVFAFSAPLKMMLHPGASFYFSRVAGISVSGYLVKFTGA